MVTQWFNFLTRDRRSTSGSATPSERHSSSLSSRNSQDEEQNLYDENILWFPTREELPNITNSIKEDTDCILCCDVLMNPVSLPCGHSVCQVCLAKADSAPYNTYDSFQYFHIYGYYKSVCPVCRLQWTLTPPINYVLRSMIEKLFPHKLAQRRLALGQADADTLREFDRFMRKRAARKNVAAAAERFRTTLYAVVVAILLTALLTSALMWAILKPKGRPNVDDKRINNTCATCAPVPISANFVHRDNVFLNKHELFLPVTTFPTSLSSSPRPSAHEAEFGLADQFIKRSWLPRGRIDQWTSPDVINFLRNAGLLENNALLQQRIETLKLNGSMLLNLREHQVWDANGMNITQPGTYHALMLMVYGLQKLVVIHNDPLTTFCSRGAGSCVFMMQSFFVVPHLFWLYALVFQYNRYFLPLIGSPRCVDAGLLLSWTVNLLFHSSASAPSTSSCGIVAESTSNFSVFRIAAAVLMPRFSIITILIEHHQGHEIDITIWAIMVIGTWRLLSSAHAQWNMLRDLPRIGWRSTTDTAIESFLCAIGHIYITIALTFTAWLIPALATPIVFAATSFQFLLLVIRIFCYTEKIVRFLLNHFGWRQQRHRSRSSVTNALAYVRSGYADILRRLVIFFDSLSHTEGNSVRHIAARRR